MFMPSIFDASKCMKSNQKGGSKEHLSRTSDFILLEKKCYIIKVHCTAICNFFSVNILSIPAVYKTIRVPADSAERSKGPKDDNCNNNYNYRVLIINFIL